MVLPVLDDPGRRKINRIIDNFILKSKHEAEVIKLKERIRKLENVIEGMLGYKSEHRE